MKDYAGYPLARIARLLFALLMVTSLTLVALPTRSVAAQNPQNPFDLMLVIDGSGSISRTEFELAREFSRTLIHSCLFVSGSRAGVVQYASTVQLEHGLSADQAMLDSVLINMTQIGTATATGDAINRAQQTLTANQRPNVKNFIVVLTDGQSNTGVNPITAADNARTAGSELFAIGVGASIAVPELQGIANDPDSQYLFQVTDFAGLQAALAPVVGAICGVAVTPPPALQQPVASPPAEIYAVQRMTGQSASPGSTITAELVVGNTGRGNAREVTLVTPFNPATVSIAGASFSSATAWVSALGSNSVTIKTGPLGAGQTVTGTLQLQVLGTATPGANLFAQTNFTWVDDVRGGSGNSNTLAVVVGGAIGANQTLNVVPPAAPAGTRFTFSGNFFAPREPVGVWYNLPDGRVMSAGTFRADGNGYLVVTFDTLTTLAAGDYSMVFFGHWTQVTAVGPFTITP